MTISPLTVVIAFVVGVLGGIAGVANGPDLYRSLRAEFWVWWVSRPEKDPIDFTERRREQLERAMGRSGKPRS